MSKVIEALVPFCASYLIVPGVCKVGGTFKICLRVSKMTASWGGTWSINKNLRLLSFVFRTTCANTTMRLLQICC